MGVKKSKELQQSKSASTATINEAKAITINQMAKTQQNIRKIM